MVVFLGYCSIKINTAVVPARLLYIQSVSQSACSNFEHLEDGVRRLPTYPGYYSTAVVQNSCAGSTDCNFEDKGPETADVPGYYSTAVVPALALTVTSKSGSGDCLPL